MNKSANSQSAPPDFKNWVVKSISLIGTIGKTMENEELVNFLVKEGIPEREAVEIVIFLPIAFCRRFLPQVKWLEEYIERYPDEREEKKLYNENIRYLIIKKETEAYWNSRPEKDIVINVAGRSAEFRMINDLLMANGGNLADVILHPTILLRQ
ncbi:MAG: hypothetical protein ACOYXT_22070 [Bacteroidota bacterium]